MARRNGVTRSVLLTKEQDDRLNWLIRETGVCRNQLVRLVASKMTIEDVEDLQGRP